MPDYKSNRKQAVTDVTATVNNGSATANDLVLAIATIYDNLWAVSNVDRDTLLGQLGGLQTRAKAVAPLGKYRTPDGGFMVLR